MSQRARRTTNFSLFPTFGPRLNSNEVRMFNFKYSSITYYTVTYFSDLQGKQTYELSVPSECKDVDTYFKSFGEDFELQYVSCSLA